MFFQALRERRQRYRSAESIQEALRRLSLFENLDSGLLDTVAAACEWLHAPAGPFSVPSQEEDEYFLVSGAVRLRKPSGQVLRLDSAEACARFPLPLAYGYTLQGEGPFSLLRLPGRFLKLLNGSGGQCLFEATEIDPEVIDPVTFLDFHQVLRSPDLELPSVPDLALKIGKAIDDDNTLNQDIARLIQLDPSLAARLMQIVNSAAYCAGSRIETLGQAVARLGRPRVRNLVISCVLKNLFRTKSDVLRTRMRDLWAHSCNVSAISFVLAKLTPGLVPERALLAGLLHGIGAIPILNAARAYPTLVKTPGVLNQLVRELSHEVGERIIRQWGFDSDLIHVVRESGDWMRRGYAVPDYVDIVVLAQLHAHIGSRVEDTMPSISDVPAYRKLALGELTPRRSLAVVDLAHKEIDEVAGLLAAH
jgi:HD-like signal output (HDOD) protein